MRAQSAIVSPVAVLTTVTRTITAAAGVFAPGHLGELTRQVPFEMVDEVLADTRAVQSRVRVLPSRVVVYLLLAGCLFAELGYRQVWQRLAAGLDGFVVADPTAAALTQARRRVGVAPMRALFDLLRGPAATAVGQVRWRGLLVCALDGTTMSVPDSAANLTVFVKQAGHHGGSGYPLLRLLVLVSCGTRTVIDAVFGPSGTGETGYAGRLLASLRSGMIVLADRNFAAGGAVRRDRRHPGGSAGAGQERAHRPETAGAAPQPRWFLPVGVRRRASASDRRRDHHHDYRRPRHGHLPTGDHSP